jgi:CIC family chloride channel protein
MFRLSALLDAPQPSVAVQPRDREEIQQLLTFSVFGVVMGIIGAVAAWVLYHLINIFTGFAWFQRFTTQSPLYPPPAGLGLWTIIIPVIGGLLVGVMAKYGTDRIRGHGIPEAMEAVLRHKSQVTLRVAIFKPISAAIAVGTGGPFGAEGPIIQTSGAIGSLLGQTMKMSAKERRILLACGGAAGMVGIFNTPIAAVALALELLLFEFRARSLVPVILASATAAACRTVLLGSNVMFNLGFLPSIGGPLDLLWFVPLGIIVGAASVLISKAFYITEEFFERLHVDLIFKPALGALGLGIVAFFQPRVLGMGYTYITEVLQNHFSNATLLGLGIGKSLALIVSLGSGTSGGLLAPMLLIGASLGSGYGRAVHAIAPQAGIAPGICGVVAMSSLFSAAARAPLTSFLFAFELTGDYKAILPLMIGCMVADVVARSLSAESIMTERLVRRGLRVDQGYEARLLNLVPVSEVMTRSLDALASRMPVRMAVRGLIGEPVEVSMPHVGAGASGAGGTIEVNGQHHDQNASLSVAAADTKVTSHASGNGEGDAAEGTVCSIGLRQHWTFPVLDDAGLLDGIVTRGELLDAASSVEALDRTVSSIASKQVVVAYPDESLDAALMRMLEGDFQLLPVVDRREPRRMVGVLSRRDILRAWSLRELDERQRQRMLRLTLPGRRRAERRGENVPVTITTEPEGAAVPAEALAARTVETLTPPGEQPEM